MDEIYFEALLKDRVVLRPAHIHNKYTDELLKILRIRVEEKCNVYGYVKAGSVEIVQRPIGHFQQGYMNGCVEFDVTYKAELCNPVYGNVITMNIVRIAKEVGILFENDFLTVVVPTDLETDKSKFEHLNVGDSVQIFVIDKQIQPDNTIMVIGKIYNEKTDKENTVDIGDLKKSETIKEKVIEDDSDSSEEEIVDEDSDDDYVDDDVDNSVISNEMKNEGKKFPSNAENVDTDDDSDNDKADSEEELEIEVDNDGEVAVEGEEERNEEALAKKKSQLVANEEGNESDVPSEGENNDEESGDDESGDDEFDYDG